MFKNIHISENFCSFYQVWVEFKKPESDEDDKPEATVGATVETKREDQERGPSRFVHMNKKVAVSFTYFWFSNISLIKPQIYPKIYLFSSTFKHCPKSVVLSNAAERWTLQFLYR